LLSITFSPENYTCTICVWLFVSNQSVIVFGVWLQYMCNCVIHIILSYSYLYDIMLISRYNKTQVAVIVW
jgi:hypothetical protein